MRDWLHVANHCRGIDLIVRKGRDGEIYDIGGHNERSSLEVVKTVLSLLNKDEGLIHFVKDRLGHDRRYAFDPSKIERELGWKLTHDFYSGIAETIRWYLENKAWVDHVKSGEYLNWIQRHYR